MRHSQRNSKSLQGEVYVTKTKKYFHEYTVHVFLPCSIHSLSVESHTKKSAQSWLDRPQLELSQPLSSHTMKREKKFFLLPYIRHQRNTRFCDQETDPEDVFFLSLPPFSRSSHTHVASLETRHYSLYFRGKKESSPLFALLEFLDGTDWGEERRRRRRGRSPPLSI